MSALHDPSVWLNAPGRVWMSQPLSRSEHTELVMNLVKLETWWDAKFKYSICSPIPDCSSENKRVIKTRHMLFIHERAISTIIPRWSCPWTSRIRVSDNELESVDGPHHLLSSRWLSSANPNIIHPSIHPSLPHTWPGSEVLYVETSIPQATFYKEEVSCVYIIVEAPNLQCFWIIKKDRFHGTRLNSVSGEIFGHIRFRF